MPPKFIRLTVLCALVCLTQFAYSQGITVPLDVRMPKDSAGVTALRSLGGFLFDKSTANKDNPYIYKEELPATSDLFDEIKGIANKGGENREENYYKCMLTNAIERSPDDYLFQVSYIHSSDEMPVLRASFTVLAKKVDGKFYCYSPLKQNTQAWKTKMFDNLTCHYKTTFNPADGKAYQQTVSFYNKKLGLKDEPIDFYYCDDFTEAQRILGIDYKLDYNGLKDDSFTAHENNTTLVVSGDSRYPHHFDPHDLWHERLRLAMDKKLINRPVDEGVAYLYGGSWGYTPEEVMAKFKAYAAANPNADWFTLYTNSTPFQTGDKSMYVAYALNALIAQRLEKEKGFAPVMQLLSCGPREKGDANYFAALEKVSGITKGNFNAEMGMLVKAIK